MDFRTIKSSKELADLVEEARSLGRLGLDTEFLWERSYSPQICLAQINVADEVYLADPLDGIDLAPLGEAITSPDIEVIMHAPHADLVAFAHRFDSVPSNTFDTQLSAGLIGYSAGLAYERLVQELTNKRVKPSESFSDWSRRPLGDQQLQYAGEDVEHLFDMRDKIGAQLEQRGRTEWAREEMRRRYEGSARFLTTPEEAWRKVGRRSKTGAQGLAVLREVAAWRERLARSKDLPVSWVVKDPTLIEIARRTPATIDKLKRIRGIDGSLNTDDLANLLEAIARGAESEPIIESTAPNHRGLRRRVAAAKGLATALLRTRCDAEDIAPELIGNSSDVEELMSYVAAGEQRSGEDLPFLLRGWREPFGRDLVELAEGRIQLQLTDQEPFILVHRK